MVCALVVCVASFAWANVPDLDESEATSANGTTKTSVYCLPDGQGHSFLQGYQLGGTGPDYDCQIYLTVNNAAGEPIELWPSEDMWLESDGGGLIIACVNGTAADFSTDSNGETQWTQPMNCGGASGTTDPDQDCLVMISGGQVTTSPLAVVFNSPDIDGSGQVAIADVALFAGCYLDPACADYNVDYYWDEDVNISDLVKFAQGYGAACP